MEIVARYIEETSNYPKKYSFKQKSYTHLRANSNGERNRHFVVWIKDSCSQSVCPRVVAPSMQDLHRRVAVFIM